MWLFKTEVLLKACDRLFQCESEYSPVNENNESENTNIVPIKVQYKPALGGTVVCNYTGNYSHHFKILQPSLSLLPLATRWPGQHSWKSGGSKIYFWQRLIISYTFIQFWVNSRHNLLRIMVRIRSLYNLQLFNESNFCFVFRFIGHNFSLPVHWSSTKVCSEPLFI